MKIDRPARLFRFAVIVIAFALPALLESSDSAGEDRHRPDSSPASGSGAATSIWSSRVRAEIAAREYDITWQDTTVLPGRAGAWQAPNRAHGFRTYFTEAGIRLVPRDKSASTWTWGMALLRFGRPGQETAAKGARLSAHGKRVDYDRGEIIEWYVNDPRGLEQGLTLASPPPYAPGGAAAEAIDEGAAQGPSAVHIDLAMTGTLDPSFSADGQAVDFRGRDGRVALRYAHLNVEDARGRALPARMEGFAEAGVRGIRLVFHDEEAVYPVTVDPLATSPAWTVESDQDGAEFGISVATAGDVNGDGYSDVIVGAQLYDNGETDEGRAYVYLGSASGLAGSPAWTAEGDQMNSSFGYSVATAGDVNGDGFSDVIVGAYLHDNSLADEGRAFVYLGSASGLASSPAWVAAGGQASAHFGISVATAGDVNGDGYSDVIVGASAHGNGQQDEGRAYVYLGSASGLAASPAWTAEGDQTNASFGQSVATAGDVNGDGFSDVIVGANIFDIGQADEGRAFLYFGAASGLATTPSWTADGDQASARFGYSVATAGDVNGDGYADVIVGAFLDDNGQTDEGRAFVYLGSATGLATTPSWTADGDQAGAGFGCSVATAGDVNGDGYADVIVGAWQYDNGQTDEGRVFIYPGSASGLATSPVWTAESDQSGAWFGVSVATAGDVNGDGYSDTIVGAYLYDNGQTDEGRAFVYPGSASGLATTPGWTAESDQAGAWFGVSVATAGDVNGDGYSDVIVGAHLYDNGETDEGRAFVYLGSESGLAASPVWTAESDQAGANFGFNVGTAGDVNGDGYSDVIVGAPAYDNGQADEGRAFVYLGSASGLATSPAWTAEGDQELADFGIHAGTAGDVNGDGYADVIIGANGYTNDQVVEGRAYVFLGSAVGLTASPAWTVESDQTHAGFGYSVATAGDVNGDGYSDIIVGAYGYDNGQTNEGRAFVYLGSAAGLDPSPSWTAESDQAFAQFGFWVASAGDVNGDGYADVVVSGNLYDNGQSNEGRAYVYLGSASGLATTPGWTAESDQVNAQFGQSAATAGDVNGDGYADLIVGASMYDNVETTEGRAFVYYGNGGDGLDRAPRQARADGAAPIDLMGRSDSQTSFRLRALGRSPAGRSRVGLEWEVKPLGVAFDAAGLQRGAVLDAGSPVAGVGSGVPLDEVSVGLDPGTAYHWRLRILGDSPFFPRSPWLSLPFNSWTETDLRTPVCVDGDGDGYGSPGDPSCPGGGLADCDDTRATVSPGAAEICDGLSNDCTAAGWPSTPGTNDSDDDADGLSECAGDCNDADGSTWAIPGEVSSLDFANASTLNWTIPIAPGGTSPRYDLVRSDWMTDFATGAICVEADDASDTSASDGATPPPGGVFYSLARAGNSCGEGSSGASSNGEARTVRSCP